MIPALALKGLSKTYAGGVIALKGIDLTVEQGDFFALLGPNGAGKSTTIGIISSLVNRSAGDVRIFGHDPHSEPGPARSLIGLVPQEFNFNIWEPVIEIIVNQAGYYGIGRQEAYQRAEQSLRRLELWDKRHEQAMNLSGGMKRRLMIARALVHQPKLLILDEPTAGVDIEIRRSMWAFLKEINEAGTTIILTTHYLEEAESLCRNIAIINHGEIVEDTSMRELLSRLNQEHVILHLSDALDKAPQLDGMAVHWVDEFTLEVEVARDVGVSRVFEDLHQMGIRVSSMRNKSNRLEQLFLGLVAEEGRAA